MTVKKCSIKDCGKKIYALETCQMHYARMRKNGSFELNKDPVQRFWRDVKKSDDTECWLWTGPKRCKGYGTLRANGKSVLAHRFSYTIATGKEPGDLLVCHRCDVPGCVNPAHLFLGTYKDNNRDCVSKKRHVNSRKSHCYKGHPLDGDNLIISRGRECRTCVNKRQNERYHRIQLTKELPQPITY